MKKISFVCSGAAMAAWMVFGGVLTALASATTDKLAISMMAEPIRIMRIGDSITWQMSGEPTLQNRLDDEGVDYQFVGTQNWFDDGGYVSPELPREANQNVEGYPAMTVEWFTDPDFIWYTWLARPTTIVKGEGNTPIRHALTSNTADIILLMIGTNNTQRDKDGVRGVDSSGEVDVPFLSQKYHDLLDQIELLAPQAHVIVAELIDVIDTGEGNGANRSARTLHFNEQVVRPAVQSRIDAGKPYTLLNFYSLLEIPGDYMDSVHPNITGIPKLNEAWADAIMALQSSPDLFAEWADAEGIVGGVEGETNEVPNLLRYALGGSGATPISELMPVLHSASGPGDPAISLSFNRINDPLVHYSVWLSEDLVDWGTEPVWQALGADPEGAGIEEVSVPTTSPQTFLQLKVTRD